MSIDDNFLFQAIEKRCCEGPHTHQERWIGGDMKIKVSLDFSDQEMLEVMILRAGRRVKSMLTTLDLRMAHFGPFTYLLGRVSRDKTLEGRWGGGGEGAVQKTD